jgi:hypothetical protein
MPSRLAVALVLLLPFGLAADSQKDRDAAAAAAAQHTRDEATIDRLTKAAADSDVLAHQATTGNRTAIARLDSQSKANAHAQEANSADIRYTQNVNDQEARRVAGEAKNKADEIAAKLQDTADKTAAIQLQIEQLRNARSAAQVPIWIAAIGALVTISGLVFNARKTQEVAAKTKVIASDTKEINHRVDGVIAGIKAAAFDAGRNAAEAEQAAVSHPIRTYGGLREPDAETKTP